MPITKPKHIQWDTVENEEVTPLLHRRLITGEQLMLARVNLAPGCVVPEHSHFHEQITFVIEGALKFGIDGKEPVVRSSEVLTIPPHMPHKAEAIEATQVLDVFMPPREDWLSKDDSYLRQPGPVSVAASTTSRATANGPSRHVPWDSVEHEVLNPLFTRRMIVGDKIMLARVLLAKGCVVPEHSHHNEQITYIMGGALKFWIDGREVIVRAGEVLTIPPHMPHQAEAIEDTVDLDVFTPPREDWLDKSDAYLRASSAKQS
jgi:quercetin dioxygenase-like cupin family protein